ncbi:OpgC domain-containing protein [Granulibacter bethesdensis]|uniref:OpgC domain-containing protein n=1 Tax=Granulibacter bethesdensis TaxID=364410 RepID=UPI0003F1D2BE|nr:OpgC domain-containing protein [Granulibacter bethesdensis]AHJ64723.1 OpgC [Granulibacter bethesdensis CGDNIH4]
MEQDTAMDLIRFNRDLRIDFFRGVALWMIFVDHMPGNVLGELTLKNIALSDAMEVFVMLAGYGAGLAYGKAMDRSGWLYAAAECARRAWTLYIAHIFLFVVFAAQVTYAAQFMDRTDYLDEINLDVLGADPYGALLHVLLLHYQPAYMNILPVYVVLLLAFSVLMPLLRRPWLLGGLSLTLYAATRLDGLILPNWTGGGWYFNPLAWQVLFMIGAIVAYAPSTIPHPRQRSLQIGLDALAAIMLILGLGLQILSRWPDTVHDLSATLPHLLFSIDKESLHPLRLASILAMAWLAARLIPASANWLRGRIAAPFILAGQHSLPVFCSGIFLSFMGRLLMEQESCLWRQIWVNASGTLILAGIAMVAAWYQAKSRNRSTRNAQAAKPAQEAEGIR